MVSKPSKNYMVCLENVSVFWQALYIIFLGPDIDLRRVTRMVWTC